MDHMEPRNVRFPKPHLEDLAKMSAERGVKEPELIRRALEEFLDRWKSSGGGK